jgi:glycosyltransferase involved in cell wall biosynthesis
MPCFRGETFIEASINAVENVVAGFEKDFELIVVVDGFLDRTYERAKGLESTYGNLRVLGYETNMGKGYAVRSGLRASTGTYVALLDSDMDYHPAALRTFLEAARGSESVLVVGNRRDQQSTFRYPPIRRLASHVFSTYVNACFPELGVRDTQAGIKLLHRGFASTLADSLEQEKGASGFIFDIYLLLLARKQGLRIVEAPCIFAQRSSSIGTGHNLVKQSWTMARDVWKLRQRLRRKA